MGSSRVEVPGRAIDRVGICLTSVTPAIDRPECEAAIRAKILSLLGEEKDDTFDSRDTSDSQSC
jgi:hypothetical protein